MDDLVDALAQVAFATTNALTRVAAANELSLTQLRVLAILRDRRLRVTVLADHLGLEKSTLSGLIDRAERRGLVARAPSPSDRRAVHVFLTAAGAELARRGADQVRQELAPLIDPLSPAEQRRLGQLLGRLG